VSVHDHLWNRWTDLHEILCADPMAVARPSSGGDETGYVFLVLWMTSRLAVVGRMAMHGLKG